MDAGRAAGVHPFVGAIHIGRSCGGGTNGRVRAEALFASPLQPSDIPSPARVRTAIAASIRAHRGLRGCAAAPAAEFGDHPETASGRMRWALSLAATA